MLFYLVVAFRLLLFSFAIEASRPSRARVVDNFKCSPSFASPQYISNWGSRDEELLAYISEVIPDALAHTGSTAFNEHLQGVQKLLRNWGAPDYLCEAGLLHSIYGTEGFQGFKLPLVNRPVARELIGESAERLVWIFCMVDRYSFDETLNDGCATHGPVLITARPELGQFLIEFQGEGEWLDFMELTLADWLEQVEGAAERANALFEWKQGEAWAYRRRAYRRMVEILVKRRGPRLSAARETYDAVYGVEPESTREMHQEVTPPMSEAAREAREALRCRRL